MGIFQPIDLIVAFGAIYGVYKKYTWPDIFKYFNNFLVFAGVSWVFSIIYFRDSQVIYGLLYLIRLFVYFYFFVFVYYFAKGKDNKKLINVSLLSISIASAVFGWIQLLKFPDIKPFFVYGWDEHLYRLVGTFLDPTFLALIIVFGILISFFQKKWFWSVFLIVSLIFTYSRASYLALFASVFYLAILNKQIRRYLLLIPLFLIIVLLIPTTKNHSISFFRSFSAIAKIGNYQRTVHVYKLSPVFGIGYNNLCFVKNKYFEIESYSSHACSGSDSSLLFVLATTGVVGLVLFIELLINIWKESNVMFRSILVAVLIHSIFSNSLFYPWVLGYLITAFAVNLRSKGQS